MELIIVSDNFKKLIGLLINANIKFYTGKLRGNYHIVGYRPKSAGGVNKLWEVDDRPDGLRFYNMKNPCEPYELSFEEIVKYIFIIEEKA